MPIELLILRLMLTQWVDIEVFFSLYQKARRGKCHLTLPWSTAQVFNRQESDLTST